MIEATLDIRFGEGGNDRTHLGPGWSGPQDGFRWTEGLESEFWLQNPSDATDWTLEVTLSPYWHPPDLPEQRLEILVRDSVVGRAAFGDRRVLAFPIPAAFFTEPGPVRLRFRHPDATAPSTHGHPDDTRQLGFCFHRLRFFPRSGARETARILPGEPIGPAELGRLTGLPADQFLLRFDSLGDNCEFGMVQRRCGAEPLGLLRWAGIAVADMVRGLDTGFAGIGDPANVSWQLLGGSHPEYLIHDRAYALTFHTFLNPATAVESELVGRQATRLRFLARKLIEDLSESRKIFVVKRNEALTWAEMLAVLAALRRHNDGARLLAVIEASAEVPAGTVRATPEGLLVGSIDRFAALADVDDISLESWLAICVNAARLVDGG